MTDTRTQDLRLMDLEGFNGLLSVLAHSGHDVIGPVVRDGAVVTAPVASAADFPAGIVDRQEAGGYHLVHLGTGALFDHVVGPHALKRYLFPPTQTLFTARRSADGFRVEVPETEVRRFAFIGVRACELAGLDIQDQIFKNNDRPDPGYSLRRERAFIVAVNCGRPGGTCFCASMDTGPKATAGFDLALTELAEDGRHVFVVEAGSDRGRRVLDQLSTSEAEPSDRSAAEARVEAAAESMGREMPDDAVPVLRENLESPHWEVVAKRCLNCANCTMVCPTCFCSTVEDATDLTGQSSVRTRRWDSCFTLDYSYIHGGHIREAGSARYRQWITHKLATWHDQFGTSGCTGCGRCITWCPVGIDITEEVRALRNGRGAHG